MLFLSATGAVVVEVPTLAGSFALFKLSALEPVVAEAPVVEAPVGRVAPAFDVGLAAVVVVAGAVVEAAGLVVPVTGVLAVEVAPPVTPVFVGEVEVFVAGVFTGLAVDAPVVAPFAGALVCEAGVVPA